MRTPADPRTTTDSAAGVSLDYFKRLGSPISAPATASGGPVVVIRASGADLSSLERMVSGGLPPPGTFALKSLWDLTSEQPALLDRSLVLFFKAPHSFTGEDVVEFHCHGVASVVARACESLAKLGVRTALPGEFSFRAVVHEKMTLEEAEALNGALSAESLDAQSAARLICQNSNSSDSVNSLLRELLVSVQSARGRVEAAIDFSEAEAEQAADLAGALSQIDKAKDGMAALITAYYNFGLAAAEARIVIVGRPNVGKSTLYNLLCGGQKALVSKIPGTTRDVLEARIRTASGRWIRVLDTAGIRALHENTPHDELEKIGIESGIEALRASRAIVFVAKANEYIEGASSPALLAALGLNEKDVEACSHKTISLYSHADEVVKSARPLGSFDFRSELSELRTAVLAGIEQLLARQEAQSTSAVSTPAVLSARQERLLTAATEDLEFARECVLGGRPLELAGEHLRETEDRLRKAIGENLGEEYIGQIFSQFCLGK